jgi:hypothetical protein
MTITYFVSFMYTNRIGLANGSMEIRMPRPIGSMDDVQAVARYLTGQGFTNPSVVAFSRFDGEPAEAREATR